MRKDITGIRVRYKETDRMGVVYYSNYFVWFEVARTELFRKSGMNYRDIEEKRQIFFPVVRAECDYKMPLKYDDAVTIETEVSQISKTRVVFSYTVKTGDKVNAIGKSCHVFIDLRGKPIPIPEDIISILSD